MDESEAHRLESRLKQRLEENAKRDAYQPTLAPLQNVGHAGTYSGEPGQGLVDGAQEVPRQGFPRYILEHHRDQLRREADDVQALLDVLPAKLPRQAADALNRILTRR